MSAPPARPTLTDAEGKPATVIQVHLLDNSSKSIVVDAATETVQGALAKLATKMHFQDTDKSGSYFGLYESKDGATVGRALDGGENVAEAYSRCSKLIYQIRLFMPAVIESQDPKMISCRYVQAVHDVISGKYCCSVETASYLAAFMVLEKFGVHNPLSHRPGFLTNRLFEYIPGNKFALKRPAQWEQDIFAQHKAMGDKTPAEAKASYLKVVSEAAYYGCEFFDVQLSNDVRNALYPIYPQSFVLGINGVGIVCLKPRDQVGQGLNPIERHPLSFIGRWGFKPGENFYFEMKEEGKPDRIFHLKTTSGQIISNLLTDYAMALLKELDEEEQQMAAAEGADGMAPVMEVGSPAGAAPTSGAASAVAAAEAPKAPLAEEVAPSADKGPAAAVAAPAAEVVAAPPTAAATAEAAAPVPSQGTTGKAPGKAGPPPAAAAAPGVLAAAAAGASVAQSAKEEGSGSDAAAKGDGEEKCEAEAGGATEAAAEDAAVGPGKDKDIDWDRQYYYYNDGHVQGPVPLAHLAHWVQEGHFEADIQVKAADDQDSEYVAFNSLGASAPEGEHDDAAGTDAAGADAAEGDGGHDHGEPLFMYMHGDAMMGPVPASHLSHWIEEGHMSLDVLVRAADDEAGEFVPLSSVAPAE